MSLNFIVPARPLKRHCPKCGLADTNETRLPTLNVEGFEAIGQFCLQCFLEFLKANVPMLEVGEIAPSEDDFPHVLELDDSRK